MIPSYHIRRATGLFVPLALISTAAVLPVAGYPALPRRFQFAAEVAY